MAQFLPSLTPAVDGNNNPLAGALWRFYTQSTTTPETLADGSKTATADENGEFSGLFLNAGTSYRASLEDANGSIIYDVSAINEALFSAGLKAAIDGSGNSNAGATWSFYVAGTTTPQSVYADPELTTPLGAVVKSDANGRFPEIYIDTSLSYKAVLEINGVTIDTLDPVTENAMGTFLDPEFVTSLEPHSSWDGTENSGFSAGTAAPTDPTRTTAKPACRLIVPPNQHFTDELVVGVYAAANESGTLFNNLGIASVVFNFEGNTETVNAPTLRTFLDVNGTSRTYLGWWVTLKKPTDTSGDAHLYVTATANDGTMQARSIGPYTFSPVTTLYDQDVTVGAAGADYTSLTAAITALKALTPNNPRITLTSAGPWSLDAGGTKYSAGTGRLVIEASVAATIGFASYTTDAAASMNPNYDGIEFRGSNITFDMLNVSQIDHEATGPKHWFNGVNVEISGDGRASLWRKGPRILSFVAREGNYWTECAISDVSDPFFEADLVRGCTATAGYKDVFTDARCVIGCTVSDWTAKDDWALDVDAITITGPAGATFAKSPASNDNNNVTLTAKESGATIDTFDVGALETYSTGAVGDGYTIQDVADWINGLAGWSATVVDDTRRASALSIAGQKGRWDSGDVDVSSATTFPTYFDQHGDFYQHLSTGPGENVIVADTIGYDMWAQNIFLTAGDPKDFVFVNCAFHNDPTSENVSNFKGTLSHVVIAHVTSATQNFNVQTDSNMTADSYCDVINCAIQEVVEAVGTLDSDFTFTDCVLDAASITPTNETGTVKVGDESTKFTDALAGDFTPIGGILSNLKTPVAAKDIEGTTRAATDAVGAYAS